MLAIQPIREADVVALLNDGRFAGEVEGYMVMEGAHYHGHALYRVDGDCVVLLDSAIKDAAILDGALRTCLAAAESRGASLCLVNEAHPPLAAWWGHSFKGRVGPMPIALFFGAGGCQK